MVTVSSLDTYRTVVYYGARTEASNEREAEMHKYRVAWAQGGCVGVQTLTNVRDEDHARLLFTMFWPYRMIISIELV